MSNRAGRAAIIAASFGAQALIVAAVAGLAAADSHAGVGYAAPQSVSQATLMPFDTPMMTGPMVISMSIEGQNGTVRIPSPRAGMASVLGSVQFAVQPGVDATMRITVDLPARYPADGLTFDIVQDSLQHDPSSPASPEFPSSVTVSQPGPGTRDFALRWTGSNASRGAWWLRVSIKWHGATTKVPIADLGT